MEVSVKIAWLLVALIHLMPSLSFFAPGLVEKLYGASNEGDVGVLLIHRGALFLGVLVISIIAIFAPDFRKAAVIIAAISMIGFLIVYARAGMPDGPLRKIALVDLVGLLPLAWGAWNAFSTD